MVARLYNKLNTVLEQCVHSSVCTPLHTVLEQCSKDFRTVNGAAPNFKVGAARTQHVTRLT